MDCLVQATTENADFGLLVTGYSLGAGIGHLVSDSFSRGNSIKFVKLYLFKCYKYSVKV